MNDAAECNRTRHKLQWASRAVALPSLAMLVCAGAAVAQLPVPASSQFDITGFLQEATLDPTCATNAHCGGTLKVNGHVVTVPKETIAILPANALTWQELFAQAPAPFGFLTTPPTTGLALADKAGTTLAPVSPLTTYEAHVVGNRVTSAAGGDQYIAGLIYISQQAANSGAGFITSINYATGEMLVGPVPGTRVRINDPAGRYGRVMTPDKRFTVDPDNPTIAAATGFPMCVPRFDPATTPDALCPQSNRPKDAAGNPLTIIQMNAPAVPPTPPDPTQQAPFQVGDYITFAGTLVQDCAMTGCPGGGPAAGPWPALGTAATYISAHTISANVAIYTWPGTDPAYVKIDVGLIGTGGLLVIGATEPAIRTRFEGMTTDPARIIHLFGMDLNPTTGAATDRDWGAVGVDQGLPTGVVKGRWRFRPPCTATFPSVGDRTCSPPPAGTFLPPTREVRARLQNPTTLAFAANLVAANGLITGQYHAPIFDYIFTENIIGMPIVQNDFTGLAFLAQGGYTSSAGTIGGPLNPWPGAGAPPPPTCTPAVAVPGGPYSVAATGTVTLAGSAAGTAPFTFAWAAPSAGSLSSLTIANPVYTAPLVATQTTVNLSLTVTNSCGTSTSSTTVTVNAAGNPSVNPVLPISVFSGAPGSFGVSGVDPSGLPLAFTVTQSGTPALLSLTVTSTGPSTATVSFTAPTLPVGQVTPSVINLTITARDTAGATSAPEFTSVTVNPLPDSVTITLAEYRTGKQRLIINATSSVISPNVVLKLQPYLTTAGTTFDPVTLGNTLTNNGGGLYIIDLVGAPPPACGNPAGYQTPCPATPLTVKSNLNGVSPPHALDRIRQ